jgi:hypothetical protein
VRSTAEFQQALLADGGLFFKGFLWITKHTTVASPQPVELLAFEVSSVQTTSQQM